ncbi:Exocyst subunit exo70 family protein [Rhynchospora pubera]|uniref:Exocyst subunit Exo70 family protein n=1 Tax=Rhynchospora pubera TaxID=906938 RepID=A0AAV8F556_9POAL|nr:Exocyst subunit exo70 family protein [Rhynchospora pubera]
MAPKTLRSLLAQPSSKLGPHHHHHHHQSISISQSISTVRSAISHWDPHSSDSLSPSFLQATSHLHSHLLHLSASHASHHHTSHELVTIHTLLESAMQHLKESLKYHLFHISSSLDSHSDNIKAACSIAETMLSTGYVEECVSTYQSMRQSTLKSQMVRLGFDQSAHQPKFVRKLRWETLDNQIKSWRDMAPVVVQSLCSDEHRLCHQIFAASPESVPDLIFSTITCDVTLSFLTFPETVAVNLKPSPEKLFRLLDMYVVLSDLLPDIESIFGSEPASSVRSQVISSLGKLSKAIRAVISEFELAIQKDPLNSSGVPGGAIHPLTRYVMNYLAYLSDFEHSLQEILVDLPPNCNSSFFNLPNLQDESILSVTIAWILFVLLCKIDSKAETYSDVALSYLFLANNLQYIIGKVESCQLRKILGDEWVNEHNMKARRFVEGHVRSGWAHMSEMLSVENENGDVERLRMFLLAFDMAMKERKDWVIADVAMRHEVKLMVEAMLVPAYRRWYSSHKDFVSVRFSPENIKKKVERFYEDSNLSSGYGSC